MSKMIGKRSILGLVILAAVFLFLLYSQNETDEPTFEDLQMSYEKSRTETMNSKFDSLIEEYLNRELTRKLGVGDLYSYAQKLQLFKKLHKSCGKGNTCSDELATLYKRVESHLFSWVPKKHRDIDQILTNSRGRGIVITTGDNFAPLAANSINALRVLGCDLPIEVFHHGSSDLSPKWITHFNGMKNVRTVDINSVFDMARLDVPRWAIKSFAVLGSSFTENVVLDADAVLLANPEDLFASQGYAETGTLFFTDRTMWGYQARNMTTFLEGSFLGPTSDACKSTKLYRREGNYQLKTGLILIDKSRHLFGLLATCRLNSNPDSERLRKYVHADKEFFWIGMELVEEPYYFMPTPCGSIGVPSTNEKSKTAQICGRQAHFGTDGALLWFNDGLCVNKGKGEFELAQLTHYVKETSEGAGAYDGACLRGDVQPIEGQALVNLQKLSAIYEKDPLDPTAGKSMKL